MNAVARNGAPIMSATHFLLIAALEVVPIVVAVLVALWLIARDQ